MNEPLASRDPQVPNEQAGGYVNPQPSAPPSYGAPMGSNPPVYSAPPPGLMAPYSDVVGRQLTSDEATWSMLAHLGGIVLGFLAPLIVMVTKGDESPYTRRNAVEALNFQITLIIGYVIALC